MTLHLVKLCVGASSIEDLSEWQSQHRQRKHRDGKACVYHPTYQSPKSRTNCSMAGRSTGSFVARSWIRQSLIGFEEGTKEDGNALLPSSDGAASDPGPANATPGVPRLALSRGGRRATRFEIRQEGSGSIDAGCDAQKARQSWPHLRPEPAFEPPMSRAPFTPTIAALPSSCLSSARRPWKG